MLVEFKLAYVKGESYKDKEKFISDRTNLYGEVLLTLVEENLGSMAWQRLPKVENGDDTNRSKHAAVQLHSPRKETRRRPMLSMRPRAALEISRLS